MSETPSGGPGAAEQSDSAEEAHEYVPTISMQDVFRKMIEDEMRAGQLTKSRRRRIVRFAAALGLNAVQAGRLIEECRGDVAPDDDPVDPYRALRLVAQAPSWVPESFRVWVAVAIALTADVLILLWMLG